MKKLFHVLFISLFCLGSYSVLASSTDPGPDPTQTETLKTSSSVDPIELKEEIEEKKGEKEETKTEKG